MKGVIKMLEDVIREWGGHEVTAMELYTDMFWLGEHLIQRENEPAGEFKANPLGYCKKNDAKKGKYRILFEDTFEEVLHELQEEDFAIVNGITYYGRKNLAAQASKMYAMIFDLDGVTDATLGNFFSGAYRSEVYPIPNYVALSGHGVHLYYLFDEPISLYPNIKIQLKELKYALIKKMWNQYTSESEKVQYQGINQGFRPIGGKTKIEGRRVKAFQINTHPFTLEQLCEYVPVEFRVDQAKIWKETKLTLEQAKKKYPEWYEKVIVRKDTTPKKWDIAGKVHGDNPYALYDWWMQKIREGAAVGHRYFCLMCLAIYGVKNGKSYEEVEKDALSLIPFMDGLSNDHKDPFTEEDCQSALECYDERYYRFPIKDIVKITGIEIEQNKRNGRKQAVHLGRARAVQQFDDPEGNWRNKEGAPIKAKIIKEWRESHPNGTKADCNRDTKLDPKTIRKWWNGEEAEKKTQPAKAKEDGVKFNFDTKNQETAATEIAARILQMSESEQKKIWEMLQKAEENAEK